MNDDGKDLFIDDTDTLEEFMKSHSKEEIHQMYLEYKKMIDSINESDKNEKEP